MTPTIEELEARIRTAVTKAKQEGWEISPKVFVSHWVRQCCPLGAVVLHATPLDSAGYFPGIVVDTLGVDSTWVWSFGRGFDGHLIGIDPSAYTLGKKFRAELLGEKP